MVKPYWQFIPNGLNHFARGIQPHFPIRNVPEQAFPILGADGDDIRPGPGIIVSTQPNGSAVMDDRIVFHAPAAPLMMVSGTRTRRVNRPFWRSDLRDRNKVKKILHPAVLHTQRNSGLYFSRNDRFFRIGTNTGSRHIQQAGIFNCLTNCCRAGHIFSINLMAPSAPHNGSFRAALLISETASLILLHARRDPFHPNTFVRNFAMKAHL